MSKEIDEYLANMNSAFNQAEQNIKSDFEKKPKNKSYALLWKHNNIIIPYINQIYNGPGFENQHENDRAWDSLFKRHLQFMRFYENLMDGN